MPETIQSTGTRSIKGHLLASSLSHLEESVGTASAYNEFTKARNCARPDKTEALNNSNDQSSRLEVSSKTITPYVVCISITILLMRLLEVQ